MATDAPAVGRTFEDDETLLAEVLGDVVGAVEGAPALDLHRRAVDLGRRSRGGEAGAADELTELIAGLDAARLEPLIRSLTRWFQLINLAEDNERVRRIKRRELEEAPEPRRGSLRAAVARLAADGTSRDELLATLARAEIRLVMTAHPTEARRRTTVAKLNRVFHALRALDERRPLPGEEAAARRRIAATVQELWGSDELRAASPTVLDEVRGGLVYFTSTLTEVVPALYRDLEAALEETYGEPAPAPALLAFGSWMGGDRDGNPNVTPAVTAEALELMRDACLHHLGEVITQLAERVSLSSRVVGEPDELADRLGALEALFPHAAQAGRERNPEEPYRRLFTLMAHRVAATRAGDAEHAYSGPGELLADLRAASDSLRGRGGGFVAGGELADAIRRVEVFGFHFARLDVREHAKVHRAALDEVLATLGIRAGYAELPEGERIELLARLIADPRPVVPGDVSGFSEATQQAVGTFRALRALIRQGHEDALRSYVISGTTGPADLLEVLLLMKEAELSRAGGEEARLRIVPLFEAGKTLEEAGRTMRTALSTPVYRAALDAMGGEQEVMVGYSDSNKDVGYVASGWAVYRAQAEVSAVLAEHGVDWQFFHGRGGAVGRGGGRTSVAIGALPPGTARGRLKVTEQGEVLSAKYSVTEIAHRELELTTSAALLSTASGGLGTQELSAHQLQRYEQVMAGMAERSTRAYRDLVYGDEAFARFFASATPLREVSRLQLGSRPARRKATDAIEDLRAIPWVFSWTQARIVLPGWYGFGAALEGTRAEHGEDVLSEMATEWPFFSALVSNAEMACAKADLEIGRRYAELCDDDEVRERIWSAIADEFTRTRAELQRLRGEERLLDREPVLQRSIDRRNPLVDPLSFIQLELLRRLRDGGDEPELVRASLLAINGIAGGLRNTG